MSHEQSAPTGYESRIDIPEGQKDWSVDAPDYYPPEFTDLVVETVGVEQGWADPQSPSDVDFSERFSHETEDGEIQFSSDGKPLNPRGRTGLEGRGLLGKWGPNQAADPIVFHKDEDGNVALLLIQRKDTGQWALPGGMTDPTDKNAAQTAMRELAEEAGVILEEEALTEVYAGIVDDPRNTDNAWMETKALCSVAEGERPEPTAGDDAQKAKWVNVADLTKDGLYASHGDLVGMALVEIGEQAAAEGLTPQTAAELAHSRLKEFNDDPVMYAASKTVEQAVEDRHIERTEWANRMGAMVESNAEAHRRVSQPQEGDTIGSVQERQRALSKSHSSNIHRESMGGRTNGGGSDKAVFRSPANIDPSADNLSQMYTT